jgi:hypothetical protein
MCSSYYRKEFERYGEVDYLKVVNQRGRRYAFVNFVTVEQVCACLHSFTNSHVLQAVLAKQRLARTHPWKSAISFARRDSKSNVHSSIISAGQHFDHVTVSSPQQQHQNTWVTTSQYSNLDGSGSEQSYSSPRAHHPMVGGQHFVGEHPSQNFTQGMGYFQGTQRSSGHDGHAGAIENASFEAHPPGLQRSYSAHGLSYAQQHSELVRPMQQHPDIQPVYPQHTRSIQQPIGTPNPHGHVSAPQQSCFACLESPSTKAQSYAQSTGGVGVHCSLSVAESSLSQLHSYTHTPHADCPVLRRLTDDTYVPTQVPEC